MESDIIARIDKELSDCETAGWEDVPFPEELLMECKAEIIAASSRWIPVSEELPKAGDTVLVSEYRDLLLAWLNFSTEAGTAYFSAPGRSNFQVTHWMPLPEPPG